MDMYVHIAYFNHTRTLCRCVVLPREQQGTKFHGHYNANESGRIFNYYELSHKSKMNIHKSRHLAMAK